MSYIISLNSGIRIEDRAIDLADYHTARIKAYLSYAIAYTGAGETNKLAQALTKREIRGDAFIALAYHGIIKCWDRKTSAINSYVIIKNFAKAKYPEYL